MPFIKELRIHGFKSFARETTIPFKNNMNVIVGPNGSGKSCHYSTLVTLSDGEEIEIGKLVEAHLNKTADIKKLDDGVYVNGDNSIEILSLNKNTMKIERKTISKFIKRDGEEIYKIRTRLGKEVKATGCHPVMAFRDGEIRSVLIRDLAKGSLIASPRNIEISNPAKADKDFARFIGYIIGYGYIAKDRIEFVNNDEEAIQDFKNLLINKMKVDFRERHDKNVTRLYTRDKQFVDKIRNLFFANFTESITSKIKKIPSSLMAIDKESAANLLAGLFDTDGSVRKNPGIIEYCTKNRELASQVQSLLLRFGIISKIKLRKCCATNTINKIKRDYYYIYIYGIDNLRKFYSNIPLRVKLKSDNLKESAEQSIISNPNTDILPKEVNYYVGDLVKLLGIKTKPLRKEFPFLMAYMENRCYPTRIGLSRIIHLFEHKFGLLKEELSNIRLDQLYLVECMNNLDISGQEASRQIGLHSSIIMRDWATSRFNAKPENLQKLYNLVKMNLSERMLLGARILSLLKNLAKSDIYWDEIVSIEKLEKEEYVYDLTIEDNHNFIANNFFVHNSNVTDAICFVLGRMGSKSMRAKRLSNLIFAGTQQYKPSSEASVEMIFDNTDKGFSLNDPEVSIKRVLRRNGQGIYKINNEIKTRQEVLELLSQAGIDPNGFNIVLQGEIDSFVKMPPDKRREVIEEVAGISIYEMRKQKSIAELDKTEAKLKEVNAILRERNAYLRNLEDERKNALRFKKLQDEARSCKASIYHNSLKDKDDRIAEVNELIDKEQGAIAKINSLIEKIEQEIALLNEKTNNISTNIQKASGLEQEKLNAEISDLRAELAGITIKKQNYETQLQEMKKKKEELVVSIKKNEEEVSEMGKTKGKTSFKKEIAEKKKQLEEIDEQKRRLYQLKSNLSAMSSRTEDKQRQMLKVKNESEFILNRIRQIESEIRTKDESESQREKIVLLKTSLEKLRKDLEDSARKRNDNEKIIAVSAKQMEELGKIKSQVSSLDICPLCKTKITKDHVNHVVEDVDKQKSVYNESAENSERSIKDLTKLINEMNEATRKTEEELRARSQDLLRLDLIAEKKNDLRKLSEDLKIIETEHSELNEKKAALEKQMISIKTSEENYDSLRLSIQEMERHEEKNAGMEVTMKQRDLDRLGNILKQTIRELDESAAELAEITEKFKDKNKLLEEKNKQDMMLKERFKKILEEKNKFQEKIHFYERDNLHKQNDKHTIEEKINNMKIERAQFLAQKEAIMEEAKEFKDAEIVKSSTESLRKKLDEVQNILNNLGTVNLRALEIYDDVKAEYDKIQDKANKLLEEKGEIMKVIEDIDKKKKKAFVQTLEQVNSLFSRNFSQLSTKGVANLEPTNPEDIFAGGIEMLIKVGKGKYFDTHSLSGGEQSLISLSLIFAIQEYKPYCFYIFDEIDAALDRRNSELLATLLKRYMKNGQYLIITHNDSLITESPVIYGVSMQDKISKVVSLEI